MLDFYLQHIEERKKIGIPPRPLDAEEVLQIMPAVFNPPPGQEEFILGVLKNYVLPGVDSAAKEKARILKIIALGERQSKILSREGAVELLGEMGGGYNVEALVDLLHDKQVGVPAAEALKKNFFIFSFFEQIKNLAKKNERAKEVLASWAKGEWFTRRPRFPEKSRAIIFKVSGEINTDDFSPAKRAGSRADIPLHALSLLATRSPGAIEKIKELKKSGWPVAFAGDVVGTGSSRKSAINSLLWWIGEDIPGVPNKRRGGIILGTQIAPIFFNTARDSGALPIKCDVSKLETGMIVDFDFVGHKIMAVAGKAIVDFKLEPETLADEYRVGGRLNLIIGKDLTRKAQEELGVKHDLFLEPKKLTTAAKGYTLAQKIVGRACGFPGVEPGQACLPRITTVGSQDTTGPMTAEEIKELACLEFQAPMVMQSFCHTAAYPTEEDKQMHKNLAEVIRERGGLVLKPGDGVIHSWLNRLLLPDTVGTGGDSHTRFPIGISFPAGSGLVAFAAALGIMPLDMPESVLVKFKGKLNPGITWRDAVNAIPYFALQEGKLSLEKKNKKNIFNSRIMEIEGLENISVDQAFEFTDASAERSAEAATIALPIKAVTEYLKNNLTVLKTLKNEGYGNEALTKRIKAIEDWLAQPKLLVRDAGAKYAETIKIDLAKITEPLLACPNDPDNIKNLSTVAGQKIDEVFIGSCMTNVDHFDIISKMLEKADKLKVKLWLAPPTRLIEKILKDSGVYQKLQRLGAKIEIPGCSLCMGNQARVADRAIVFSTSTRNFDNRMGKEAQVYLGSAELAAIIAILGKIPTVEEYFFCIDKK